MSRRPHVSLRATAPLDASPRHWTPHRATGRRTGGRSASRHRPAAVTARSATSAGRRAALTALGDTGGAAVALSGAGRTGSRRVLRVALRHGRSWRGRAARHGCSSPCRRGPRRRGHHGRGPRPAAAAAAFFSMLSRCSSSPWRDSFTGCRTHRHTGGQAGGLTAGRRKPDTRIHRGSGGRSDGRAA